MATIRERMMRTFTTVLAGTALLLMGLGPAFASCASTQVQQVGAPTGDPEKDTLGFDCTIGEVEQTGSLSRKTGGQILQVSTSMGDTEKDTLGYLWTGTE